MKAISTTDYCNAQVLALRDAAIAEINTFTGMCERDVIANLLLTSFPISLEGFEPPSRYDECWVGNGEAGFGTRLVRGDVDLWVSVVVDGLSWGQLVDDHDMRLLVERLDKSMILLDIPTSQLAIKR